MAGRIFLAQRADRRDREDVGYAAALEHIDIGPKIHFARRDAVPSPVPGKKGEASTFQSTGRHRTRRFAEGTGDLDLLRVVERDAVSEAGAPDQTDVPFFRFFSAQGYLP